MRRQLRQAAAGLTPADEVDVANDDDEDAPESIKITSDTDTSTSAYRDKDREDSELRMQLDSAEHEVAFCTSCPQFLRHLAVFS